MVVMRAAEAYTRSSSERSNIRRYSTCSRVLVMFAFVQIASTSSVSSSISSSSTSCSSSTPRLTWGSYGSRIIDHK